MDRSSETWEDIDQEGRRPSSFPPPRQTPRRGGRGRGRPGPPAGPIPGPAAGRAASPPSRGEELNSRGARIRRQKPRSESLSTNPEGYGAPRAGRGRPSFEGQGGLIGEEQLESTADVTAKKKPTPNPPATFTGFRELRVRDMLVILGLWALRFFVPWVAAWHEFVLYLLIDPSHWKELEGYFFRQRTAAYSCKVVICFGTALMVDFINFKYPVYMILLLLYISAPAVGVLIIIFLEARSYDLVYYAQWWPKSIVMMMWATSVPFVAFPIQFSCIFNQERNMSRMAHYHWTAIFVFLEVLSHSISFWVIPPNCPTGNFTLYAMWCAIAVLILFAVIEILSLMRWAKPQIKSLRLPKKKPTDGTVVDSKAEPDSETEPTAALMLRKLVWFLIMLAPVVFSSQVYGILKRTRPEEDWDKHKSITATSMLINGQCLGVLFVVAVLFAIRKFGKRLPSVKVLSPDVLALGLPHAINALALLVVLARFYRLAALNEGDIVVGPIPTTQVSVVEFYNVEFRNRTICVHSEFFGRLKVPPRQRASAVLKDPGGEAITFNVTLDPRTTPPIPVSGSFTYEKGVWVTFIITLPASKIDVSDIEAFYSALELIRVNGTAEIRPQKQPLVSFINSYVTATDGWYFNVTYSGGKLDNFNVSQQGVLILKQYPPGDLTITYYTEFDELVKIGNYPVTITLTVEEYSVYTVILCLSNAVKDRSNHSEPVPRMLQAHKTVEIAGPKSDKFPGKEVLEKDTLVVIGLTLAGMAKAGVYIGYVYLFWLDFPLKGYRTTILAVLWILLDVSDYLIAGKIVDIGVKQITVMFAFQILFTGVHFASAIFLYTPKFNFRTRAD